METWGTWQKQPLLSHGWIGCLPESTHCHGRSVRPRLSETQASSPAQQDLQNKLRRLLNRPHIRLVGFSPGAPTVRCLCAEPDRQQGHLNPRQSACRGAGWLRNKDRSLTRGCFCVMRSCAEHFKAATFSSTYAVQGKSQKVQTPRMHRLCRGEITYTLQMKHLKAKDLHQCVKSSCLDVETRVRGHLVS